MRTLRFLREKSNKTHIALFAIALTVKLLSAGYILYLNTHQKLEGYDTPFSVFTKNYPVSDDTVNPMENYVSKGIYYRWTGTEVVYAGRLPHYTVPYYIFRQFFSIEVSYFCVSLFQMLVECIAIICLSLLAEMILKSLAAFYWTYILQVLSLNSSIYNLYIDPLSLSISTMVISLYFFYAYLKDRSHKTLIISGLLFAYGVTLRPYMGMYYPIFFSALLILESDLKSVRSWVNASKRSIMFFIPLALLLLPWIIRNYNVYHKFVPMQIDLVAGEYFPQSHFAYRKYISAWGESFQSWDKRSAGSYFEPKYKTGSEFVFPDYVFTTNYSMKEIEAVKDQFVIVWKTRNDSLDKDLIVKFNAMTDEFIKEKTFRYYIISPLLRIKKFLGHSGSYYLPINKKFPSYKSYQLLLKLLQSTLYYFTLIVGMIGLIYLSINNKNNYILLAIPSLLILFFVFYMKDICFHYFAHSYPILVMGSFGAMKLLLKIK